MLTLEAPQFGIRGLTIFRDYTDNKQYYYLPSDRVRVTAGGKSLSFVTYTEDISGEPDFSLTTDHAGGFLSLEVELGPSDAELAVVRSELESLVKDSDIKLAQVPMTDGSVTLSVLSQTGATSTGQPSGFAVSVAGSTKPSLFGRQTAAFSTRLGGDAANLLYHTLKETRDPQAVVTYDLQFLAVRPAYNLEVEIDFKETFSYLRHRVGLNMLVASMDLDMLTQELVNQGKITVKEVDYSGKVGGASPLAADGGILKLVRDLMSPSLFTTLGNPLPEYSALPDSASTALRSRLRYADGALAPPEAIRVEDKELKMSHIPLAGSIEANKPITISVEVEIGAGVPVPKVRAHYRLKGKATDIFTSKDLTEVKYGEDAEDPQNPQDGPQGAGDPKAAKDASKGVSPDKPPDSSSDNPATRKITFTGEIEKQPSGTTLEYYISAGGGVGKQALLLPAEAHAKPLSFTVAVADTESASKGPSIDGPLVGYSLRMMDITQQTKRSFLLNRAEAVIQHYHPAGILSRDGIGPQFDPKQQMTLVALGEGPFKIVVLTASACFDFETYHILKAEVHIEYPSDNGELQQLPPIPLNKDTLKGQIQFFANNPKVQEYRYYVEFSVDPQYVIGAAGKTIRSATLRSGLDDRSISVTLYEHLPLIPVELVAGTISFSDTGLKQVQVRIALTPESNSEGRTLFLPSTEKRQILLVMPADSTHRTYFMRQTFFFKEDSIFTDHPEMTDAQVVVNDPEEHVLRISPRLVDPWGVVDEAVVDISYTHQDGDRKTENATLSLLPATPRGMYPVILRPRDTRQWSAITRFIVKKTPLPPWTQTFQISEPFLGLSEAGFRVVAIELLEDPVIFAGSEPQVLAIRLTLGKDPKDHQLPQATSILRKGQLSDTVVVPDVGLNESVNVLVEVISRQKRTSFIQTVSPGENTFFVTLPQEIAP